VLACFTTAVVLTSLFAEFLQVNICKNKISEPWAMIITLALTFFVSTLAFSGIALFLTPILETIYPALIVLTAMGIAHKLWKTPIYRWVVAATFIITLASQVASKL
jgi:branched-chain amino acid:cation transporter, LIVCS family